MTAWRTIEMKSEAKDIDALGRFTYRAFFVGLATALLSVALISQLEGGYGNVLYLIGYVIVGYGVMLHILIFGGLTFVHRWRHRNEPVAKIRYTRYATRIYGGIVAIVLSLGILLCVPV